MSAPQGRARRREAEEEDEVVSMVGQRVWFVDQIEPVGTIRETIPPSGGRVIGFVIEDEKTRIVRKVQRSRVRKYGDRHFLVTAWFAKADQAAKDLEKQLTRGLAPDRTADYWQRFSAELGEDTLRKHLARVAPPTYAVAGQLATAAESLSHDLARAAVTYRRVQRALVANQAVMSPEEYAQFVDEARKWSRTVRLVLMSLEVISGSLPRAAIDVRNPDAPLPSVPVYIPFESLMEAHTPAGEGKARERPMPPTVESGTDQEFNQVFGAEAEGDWQEAEDFEATGATDFAPIKALKDYEDEHETFEAVAEPKAAEAFEPVEAQAQVEAFEEFEAAPPEEPVTFEEVEEAPRAIAPPPPKPAARAQRAQTTPPVPPAPAKGASRSAPAAVVQSLPEEEDEGSFAAGRKVPTKPGQWLTPPPPPLPKPSQVRQVERAERVWDSPKEKMDLDAIIAASLGKTPKKSASKASQGEIAGGDAAAPKPSTDSLSRELASLLEKSRRK